MDTVDNVSVASEFVRFLLTLFAATKRPDGMYVDLKTKSRALDVLFTLQVHRGEVLTMSRLASELDMSNQQLTKLINPLEKAGLVHREHSSANRRHVFVAITEEGCRTVEDLLDSAVQKMAPEMAVYTEEEKQDFLTCAATFERLLGKLKDTQR